MEQEPLRLASELGAALQRRGLTVATAESCTGGWIAKLVTDVPGSSAWFDRGYVTYSNASKVDELGVREATVREHGAVSHAVVKEMAEGAIATSRADVAIAVSGVAGPDGGTPDKPVGMVWLAWARRGGETEAECHRFSGDRAAVRREAARTALQGLILRLERGG